MRVEPVLSHHHLIALIGATYDLMIERLTFVPVGYATACYIVHGADESCHFLKLWTTPAGQATDAQRAIGSLPLLCALIDRGLFPYVPRPLPTRDGRLWSTFANIPYAVFSFLAGQAPPPWRAWPPELRDELARAIATIHLATPALVDVLPPRETFDIPFEDDLRRGLEAADLIRSTARPGLCVLRDRVVSRRADILAQLTRLHRLREIVLRLPGPRVLCHTDIGCDNLFTDESGRLWLLDWDDAIVAPPEHDLHAALGATLGHFLDVYEAAGGPGHLQLDQFAFSLLRRYLADMTARLSHMLTGSGDAAEDEYALAGMEAWGFAQWDALDETLTGIAAALSGRGAR